MKLLLNLLKSWIFMLKKKMRTWWNTHKAKRSLNSYGQRLLVNGPSVFNRNVTVGNYCNFNGMRVLGGVMC